MKRLGVLRHSALVAATTTMLVAAGAIATSAPAEAYDGGICTQGSFTSNPTAGSKVFPGQTISYTESVIASGGPVLGCDAYVYVSPYLEFVSVTPDGYFQATGYPLDNGPFVDVRWGANAAESVMTGTVTMRVSATAPVGTVIDSGTAGLSIKFTVAKKCPRR